MKNKLIPLFLILSSVVLAQQNKIDSLLVLLKTDKEDTTKVIHLNTLSWLYKNLANYSSAKQYASTALNLSQKTGFKRGEANAYSKIGNVYDLEGNYAKALEYYFKAVKIAEGMNNKISVAAWTGNIGIVFYRQRNYNKALEYYFSALKMSGELGQKFENALWLNNIGLIYWELKNYSKALGYFTDALKIFETLGNKDGISSTLGNIGIINYEQKEYVKSIDYCLKASVINSEIGDKMGVATNLGNVGRANIKLKNFTLAEKYLLQSYAIAIEIGSLALQKEQLGNLSQLYFAKGEYKKAFEMHEKYSAINDSLFNENSSNQMAEMSTKYETEKKEQQIKLIKTEQEKERTISDAAKKRQQLILISVSAILVLVLIFALFINRSLRVTRKQKNIIETQKFEVEHQKEKIEEKNKEITDSINYAKRIQYALLAHDSLLKNKLGEHFVLFKPKDIVSGDFYWATKKGNRFYLAVCDSTGHGVPGAFMSLLNISFLNEAIIEKDIVQPNEILNHVRQRLIENISYDGGKDGMDAILLCMEQTENLVKINYAAANNAPVLIKNNELTQLPSDKMPVGKGIREDSFTLQTMDVEKGDTIYLYTDGYADQFGGEDGKKFLSKNLKALLLKINQNPMDEQMNILGSTFDDWKKHVKQIDDVTVVGIRI